jgi:protein SCO1/2
MSTAALLLGRAEALHYVLIMLTVAVPAYAQGGAAPTPGRAATEVPAAVRGVGIDQKLGTQLPLDLTFTDERGRDVRLGEYFGERPVVLALVYYECPMLCTYVLNGLLRATRALSFDAGRHYDIVAVSFDPAEDAPLAAMKKQAYVQRYGRPGTENGWHFLTGKPDAIRRLTDAVGFHYKYDETARQFAHGAAIMVATPDGTLARYFYGIEYAPRDLRFGLVEASAGKVGTAIDQLMLLCYHYDPAKGAYGATAMGLVRVGGAMTLFAIGAFVIVSLRRERHGRARL